MLHAVKMVTVGLLMAGFASSCGSDPIARPFQAKEQLVTQDRPAPPSKTPRKARAGKVTFAGLSETELDSIRVILEAGSTLFRPANTTYDQVDGFWWRGEEEQWFKIPDLSEAWVGKAPKKYDRDASRGDLKVFAKSGWLPGMLEALDFVSTGPAWVPDAGQTKSPIPRPGSF